jgi:hypothetical protein
MINPFYVLDTTRMIRLDAAISLELFPEDQNDEYKYLTENKEIPDFVLAIGLGSSENCHFVADKDAAKFLVNYLSFIRSTIGDDSFEFPEEIQDLMNFYGAKKDDE